jgi:hypothetical protein
MPLITKFYPSLTAILTGLQDFATPSWIRPQADPVQIDTGVAAGQADKIFSDQRTVNAASNDDLDLVGVSLVDPFGAVLSFVKIKAISIYSLPTNVTNLTIGNGANPFIGPFGAAAHTVQVQPGGKYEVVAPGNGWTPVAATGDILRIANAAGAAATYNIDIIGTSA